MTQNFKFLMKKGRIFGCVRTVRSISFDTSNVHKNGAN